MELPAPNVTSTAGKRLPNTSVPNHTPHLREAMTPALIETYLACGATYGSRHGCSFPVRMNTRAALLELRHSANSWGL